MKTKKYLLLAAGAALVGLMTIAASKGGQGQHKLGGAFIGSGGGIIWNAFQIPLDPAGRTAAIRVNGFTYGDDIAGLLASFGADGLSELTGQGEMVSRNTAKARFLSYATKQGNPPLIGAILVWTGTITFNDPNNVAVDLTLDVYPAALDADGDGFPDPGTTPVLSVPYSGTGKRVLP